jgi:hypothetical protein
LVRWGGFNARGGRQGGGGRRLDDWLYPVSVGGQGPWSSRSCTGRTTTVERALLCLPAGSSAGVCHGLVCCAPGANNLGRPVECDVIDAEFFASMWSCACLLAGSVVAAPCADHRTGRWPYICGGTCGPLSTDRCRIVKRCLTVSVAWLGKWVGRFFRGGVGGVWSL